MEYSTMILGANTKRELDEALIRLRKNATIIKKIVDTRSIDREKLRQLFIYHKNVHAEWSKIGAKLYHWDDVIEK